MATKKLPKYSGDNSNAFWKRINAVKGRQGEMLYGMGCVLQSIEHAYLHAEWNTLDELEACEKKRRKS